MNWLVKQENNRLGPFKLEILNRKFSFPQHYPKKPNLPFLGKNKLGFCGPLFHNNLSGNQLSLFLARFFLQRIAAKKHRLP